MPEIRTNSPSSRLSALLHSRATGLLLVSVLGLFLEMLLIRWISTEIRIFAYLQNTVLVVCFLGLGMGCFTSREPIRIRRLLIPLAVLTTILAVPLLSNAASGISSDLNFLSDVAMWQYDLQVVGPWQAAGCMLRGVVFTAILIILLWETFVPVGRLLGRWMDEYPSTIAAYSINVFGSLLGIWLFAGLSVFYCSPFVWAAVVCLLLLPLVWSGKARWLNLGLMGVILVGSYAASREPGALEIAWSPYQKLVLKPIRESQQEVGDYFITVNKVGYQAIVDLSPAAVASNAAITPEMRGMSQYDIPLLFKSRPQKVLVVGAGSGNDVAGALRGGAQHVTAVDIDPAIIDMGRRYHPEHPYASDKVRIVNDDARSFFATTNDHYDLIIFGLLDSHTTTSMTNARLDHYVYTRESLERARSLLTPDGVVVLTFMVQEPFIADRMARSLREVFGYEPLVFGRSTSRLGWGGVAFVTGNREAIATALAANPKLRQQIATWQAEMPIALPGTTPVATDDWPYIYLPSPRIPVLYFLLAGLLGGLFWYGQRRLKIRSFVGWTRSNWHFFFLGAAFLLLEVQNISKAAVVLGNTWLVNAVVISGVLGMILLANLVAACFPRLSQKAVGCGLIGTCIALYFIDLSQFAFLPYALKAVIVGALTALPMFFSGLVFIHSFAHARRKDLALGANLIGSLVGAVLQSLTFITGIKALLLIVAGLYLAALLTRPKLSTPRSASDLLGYPRKDQLIEADEDEAELPEPLPAH
jgi:spermidine synthase